MARHLDFVAVAIGVLPFVLGAAWAFGSLVRPSTRPITPASASGIASSAPSP